MNTEQLAKYIASPELITNSDIPVLKELTEKHTYSSVLSLLYISAISRLQSIDLDNAIQQHAYRLSDRNRLYHLIHQKDEQANTQIIEQELEIVKVVKVVKVDEIEEKNTTSSVINVEINTNEEPKEEIEFSLETTAFSVEQDYFAGVKKDEKEIVEPLDIQEELEEEGIQKEQTTETEFIQPSTQTDKKSFGDWLRSSEEVEKIESIKLSKQQIIDQFIQKEPTISRPKAEFFSPSKKAKASLDEDTVPISETLAKIYAAQGNFPKAIHVYHQLMLSYPEKKSLFAVAIEDLKKKITP